MRTRNRFDLRTFSPFGAETRINACPSFSEILRNFASGGASFGLWIGEFWSCGASLSESASRKLLSPAHA